MYKLDDIVNKYNNTSCRTIKMKRININPSIYIDFDKENNKRDPKFKVSDIVTISKSNKIFCKNLCSKLL